ncbi:hypothetical protein ACM8C1_003942 [Vibrio parahaemolyticus]
MKLKKQLKTIEKHAPEFIGAIELLSTALEEAERQEYSKWDIDSSHLVYTVLQAGKELNKVQSKAIKNVIQMTNHQIAKKVQAEDVVSLFGNVLNIPHEVLPKFTAEILIVLYAKEKGIKSHELEDYVSRSLQAKSKKGIKLAFDKYKNHPEMKRIKKYSKSSDEAGYRDRTNSFAINTLIKERRIALGVDKEFETLRHRIALLESRQNSTEHRVNELEQNTSTQPKRRKKAQDEDKLRFKDLRKKGRTAKQIASATGFSERTVKSYW